MMQIYPTIRKKEEKERGNILAQEAGPVSGGGGGGGSQRIGEAKNIVITYQLHKQPQSYYL